MTVTTYLNNGEECRVGSTALFGVCDDADADGDITYPAPLYQSSRRDLAQPNEWGR